MPNVCGCFRLKRVKNLNGFITEKRSWRRLETKDGKVTHVMTSRRLLLWPLGGQLLLDVTTTQL